MLSLATLVSIVLSVALGTFLAIRLQSSRILEKYLSRLFEVQREVSQEIDRQQATHSTQLQQERLNSLIEQKKQMDEVEILTREKLDRIAEYFRASLASDPTTKVLAAAYQYVATNPTPRNIRESELLQAVVEHEKAGSPYLENAPKLGNIQDYMN